MQGSSSESSQSVLFYAGIEVVEIESVLASVMLAMEMKTKLDKCCIVLAIARVMLWLKSVRYCSSAVVFRHLSEYFPFF